jgi:hypothetical protein
VFGVAAGFLMRGPITTKINSYQMANWVNESCEVKQRMVQMDVKARRRVKQPFTFVASNAVDSSAGR